MIRRHSCGGMSRRQFLAALGAGTSASLMSLNAPVVHGAQDTTVGELPGPYLGRVVETQHPGMIMNGTKSADAIDAAMQRGMAELTGADDAQAAWRSFFELGDVVGIKVNPVATR